MSEVVAEVCTGDSCELPGAGEKSLVKVEEKKEDAKAEEKSLVKVEEKSLVTAEVGAEIKASELKDLNKQDEKLIRQITKLITQTSGDVTKISEFNEAWMKLNDEEKIVNMKKFFSTVTIDEKTIADHKWLVKESVIVDDDKKISLSLGELYEIAANLKLSVKDKTRPPSKVHPEELLHDSILLHIYRMAKMCIKDCYVGVEKEIDRIEVVFGLKKPVEQKKTPFAGLISKGLVENVVNVVNNVISDGESRAMLADVESDLENVTDMLGAFGALVKVMGNQQFMSKIAKFVEQSPLT